MVHIADMANSDLPRFDPVEYARLKLIEGVRGVFNDVPGGEAPVPPSDMAFFAKDSPIRMVHADVVSMMVGGMAALLLQMLHPHALRGVLDFSDFRADMHGRLRRTARFIAVTTYGHSDDAEAAIERVNRIHTKINGTLPDGTPYSATDPRVLAWVHVTEAMMFLEAWLVHVQPDMPMHEQDEYFRQFALIAKRLGADPVPETKAEAMSIFREMRSDLRASPEAREVAALIINGRAKGAAGAVQPFFANAATALIPPFARTMLDLDPPGLGAFPARLVTGALGGTLRWAFRQRV
ncbi:hypothetical protein CP97_11205 [Aurantiacibacter atlanticus]|uniref:ER-bound oxygenase mpaB/mpaB'/Rubber oxygenase catalytic domain-containing protein n=1 Tax=Aurantiacibacter atlanticus TaxID=1648404 RepID=A0A0H4VCR3_9SPHN|nr:oxygenase MpaB family protein [Aurantiacibacter atlanticus]AKQ42472.2 hypothetical protein CP97_11205 [Aurantiacibacter atlanticus]MDF1834133.1 oxygenase MpaB family protein [Alteraurantiacibacter sp. bin_em_oilr2.035]